MKRLQSPDLYLRRLSLRYALAAVLAAGLLAGCAGRHPPVRAAAVVAGAPIRQVDVQRYMDYTARFYAWAKGADAYRAWMRCERQAKDRQCRRLHEQVLARLIEERVVLSYAKQHHIALSPGDRSRITREMRRLTDTNRGTTTLFTRGRVDPTLMRSILQREILVQKVEDAVAPASARGGTSFHVEKFLLPVDQNQPRSAVYRQAVDLATDGKPIPAAAQVRFEWLAPFRLEPEERSALEQAQPGDHVGPFAHPRGYLVILLLARGTHAYGQPARLILETRYFHAWLARQVHRASPTCFDPSGATISCPLGDLKLT